MEQKDTTDAICILYAKHYLTNAYAYTVEAANSILMACFFPICCPQLSDFISIVLTHYIRLNLNPLIVTLQFLLHTLPLLEAVCHIAHALICWRLLTKHLPCPGKPLKLLPYSRYSTQSSMSRSGHMTASGHACMHADRCDRECSSQIVRDNPSHSKSY